MDKQIKKLIIYGFIVLSIGSGAGYLLYLPVTNDSQKQLSTINGPVNDAPEQRQPRNLGIESYSEDYLIVRDELDQLSLAEQIGNIWNLSQQISSLPGDHPYGIEVTELLLEKYLSDHLSDSVKVYIAGLIQRENLYRFQISDKSKQYLSERFLQKPATRLSANEIAMLSLFDAPRNEDIVDEVLEYYLEDPGFLHSSSSLDAPVISSEGWMALRLKARNDESTLETVIDFVESTEPKERLRYFQDLELIDDYRVPLYLSSYVFSDEEVVVISHSNSNEYLAWYALKALQNYYPGIPVDSELDLHDLTTQREEILLTRRWLEGNLSSEELQLIGVLDN